MKNIKRIICLLLLSFLLTTITSASGNLNDSFQYPQLDMTVEFLDGNELTLEMKQRIADYLVGLVPVGGIGENEVDNILCVLFGHQTSVSTVAVIRHKVNIHEPRCRKELYRVTACSRCDYTVDEFMMDYDIYCHPEDQIN